MKKRAFFFTFLILINPAFASEIWVTIPLELTSADKLHRLTEKPSEIFKNADLVSLFDALMAHPISGTELQELFDLEKDAQNLTLSGDFTSAYATYKKILTKLTHLPNVNGIEKITLNSLIRKAEIADLLRQNSSQKLWKQAHAWAPDISLSQDIYSPQVINRFNSLKETLRDRTVLIRAKPESAAYLDGIKLKLKGDHWSSKVEPGFHQAAVLVPGSLWEVKNFTFAPRTKSVLINFNARAAVAGTCEHPEYTGVKFDWNAKLLAEFDRGACERIFDGKEWYTERGELLAKVAPPATGLDPNLKFVETPRPNTWIKNLTQSPWFWVGSGILVAGATALIIQNQQPTETVVVPYSK